MARSKKMVRVQSDLFAGDVSPDVPVRPQKRRFELTAADALLDGQVPLSPKCCGACTETFLSDRAVAARYDVTRATIWRWVANYPEFSRPIRISPGTTRWRVSDLVAFDARRSADGMRGSKPRNGAATT